MKLRFTGTVSAAAFSESDTAVADFRDERISALSAISSAS